MGVAWSAQAYSPEAAAMMLASGGVLLLFVVSTIAFRGAVKDAKEGMLLPRDTSSTVWRFPPREDKDARRSRWNRACRVVTGTQYRPPLLPLTHPADFSIEQVVAAFAQERPVCKQRGGGRRPPRRASPPQLLQVVCDSGAAPGDREPPAEGSEGPAVPPPEVEKVKQRILQELLAAGAPRSLTAIEESEDTLGYEGSSEDSLEESGDSLSPVRHLAHDSSPRAHAVDAGLALCQMAAHPTTTLDLRTRLDGEPIMMLGTVQVTREMLWTALAQISVAA